MLTSDYRQVLIGEKLDCESQVGLPAYGVEFAQIYDALMLGNKNYAAEIETFVGFLHGNGVEGPSHILDFGCGTGTHALLLNEAGFHVTGIDQSHEMIAMAKLKAPSVSFIAGTLSDLSDENFDVCCALFNVINCLEGIDDLQIVIRNMWTLLQPGGLVFLEAWNGIAALVDPPVPVNRKFVWNDRQFLRLAEPEVHELLMQRLTINYFIRPEDDPSCKVEGQEREKIAVHHLRLFTPLEIQSALVAAGFERIEMRTALPLLRENPGISDRMLAFVATKPRKE